MISARAAATSSRLPRMAAVIGCSTSSDLAAGRAQRLQPGVVVEVEVEVHRLVVLRTVIVGPQERKAGS